MRVKPCLWHPESLQSPDKLIQTYHGCKQSQGLPCDLRLGHALHTRRQECGSISSQYKAHVSIVFYYTILYTNMEGLRELRGMAVFPAEETTRGYFCYLLLFN